MAGNAHPAQATALLKFANHRGLGVSFYLPAFLLFSLWLWPFAYGPLPATWPDLFAWTIGLCLCLLLRTAPQNMALVVASGCLCAAIASSLLGIVQYFGMGDALWPFLVRAELGTAYANLRQVNHLATLLAVGFWALLWLMPRWEFSKIAVYICGLILAVAMAATSSRTGALQFLFVGWLTINWRKPGEPKTIYFAAFVVLAYFVASAMLPRLLELVTGYEARVLFDRMWMNQGCSSRAVLWGNVLHLISLKPLTGWGWGELAYAHYITLYDGLRFCAKLGNAHNLVLHTAAILGIPVAAGLAALLSGGIYLLKPWRETHLDGRLAWGILGLLLIHSMLEYPLWFGNFQVLGLLCLAILWLQYQVQSTKPKNFLKSNTRNVRAAAAVMMLAMAWTGWDYLRVSQLYLPAKDRLAMFEVDTLNKVRNTALFSTEVLFAQVNNTTPDSVNAKAVLSGALIAIHGYPEPRVVKKLIAAALLSGNKELAEYHALRFKSAWPQEYADFLNYTAAVGNSVNPTP